jgi:autotransporter-associated beta strand protein
MKPRRFLPFATKSYLLAVSLLMPAVSFAQTWTGATSASWGTADNWSPSGVPASSNTTTITLTGSTRTNTYLEADRTIKSLTFDANADTNGRVRFSTDSNSGDADLIMDTNSGSAQISVDAGATANWDIGGAASGVDGVMILQDNLIISHNGSGTLSITRPITEGSVGKTVTLNGSGITIFSGANTYTGVTTVSSGTLRNGSADAFTNKGDLDVDGTGAFDLNGFDASFRNLTDDNAAGTITNTAGGDAKKIAFANTIDDDDHLRSAKFTGNLAISIANSNSSTSFAGLRTDNSFTGGIILRDGSGFTSTTVGTRLRINAAITGTPFGTGAITIGQANTDKAGIFVDTVANTISNDIVFNTALGTDFPGMRIQSTGNILSGQITANLADATFSTGNLSTNIGSVSLTGKLTGSQGLALTPRTFNTSDDGTLTVTLANAAGTNDYSGNTTISKSGNSNYTLALGASNQISNGTGKGNVTVNATLDLATFSDTINGLTGFGTIKANGGTLTVGDNDATSTFSGVMQDNVGTFSLTKTGAGTLTLSGANTYTGTTTISNGTLIVGDGTSGSLGNTAVTVANGATLGGSGTIGGDLVVNGTHAVGNSPGVQTVNGNATYNSNSIFEWELTANTGTQGTSPNFTFDQVIGTATKNLNVDPDAIFKVVLNGSGSAVDFTQAFWASNQSWTVFSGFATGTDIFSLGSISADVNSISHTSYGSFSLARSGGNISLDWTAVPEPTSALAGILLGAGLLRRRRQTA